MIYKYGEPWWNDIDRGRLKNLLFFSVAACPFCLILPILKQQNMKL
jgi:hypothetical protein